MPARRLTRETVRALVLTPEKRVLLLRYDLRRAGGVRWLTPGGRREGGESAEAGVQRELEEETGLRDFRVGPMIWRRRFRARRIDNHEQFFLVRVPQFEPTARQMGRRERSVFDRFQWWSAAEIEGSTARFEPQRLAHLLRELLSTGTPERPVDVGR